MSVEIFLKLFIFSWRSTDCSGHAHGHVHGCSRTHLAEFWGHVHGHVADMFMDTLDMFEYDILKFFFAFFDAIVIFGKCDW